MTGKILANKNDTRVRFILLLFLAGAVCFQNASFLFAEDKNKYSLTTEKSPAPPEEKREDPPPAHKKEWETIKSAYFTIQHRPDADLKRIERKLKQRRFYIGARPGPGALGSYREKIAHRLDYLFKRAKEILGMNPRKMQVKIKIFKNKKELNDQYEKLFKKRPNYISFYIYKYDTIYTSEDHISDSVMAHEMGHSIVDHYFAVRPPDEVREILATYVDAHLED